MAEKLDESTNAPPLPDKAELEVNQETERFPPPYPLDDQSKAKLAAEPELYSYWQVNMPESVDCKKPADDCCREKTCEERGEEIKMRLKKRSGRCSLSLVALILLVVVAYQAGKRVGFWHGHRFGEEYGRGCGNRDHHRGDDRRGHDDTHHDDGGHHGEGREGSDGGNRRECDYRQSGHNEYNHGEICAYDSPHGSLEYDRNINGQDSGSSWIQLMREDRETGNPRALQILEFVGEDGEHQCMVMEGFFAELGSAVVNNFESFRQDVVNALPFLNSTMSFAADQVRKMMLVAEELHGEDRDDAVRDTEGYCTEDSRFYSMSRDLQAQYNECLHGDEEEFMMPLNYSGPAGAPGDDSNPHGHHHHHEHEGTPEHDGPPPQPRVNMGLYTFCIQYAIAPSIEE